MEGLDGERPLQTGEVVIIVVVLLMWAGEYRMGPGTWVCDSRKIAKAACQEKRGREGGREGWWREVMRTSLRRKR